MSEWKKYRLGEICTDISYGYTASAMYDPIGPKFLRITDIVPNQIEWLTVPYCKSTNETTEKYRLEIGDIVIARTGATTGYNKTIKKLDYETVFASYLIRYKINKEIAHPFFIGYVLQSSLWQNYVNAIIGGSAQPGANAKQFGNFELNIPDLPTQTRIAQILTSFDDKIELLGQMNQTLETMAQAIFKEWFVDFNFPGFDGALVDGLPKGWRKGSIYELIEVTYGFPFKSSLFNSESKGKGLIRIRDLKNNVCGFFTEEEAQEKYLINAGNIVAGMDAEFIPSIWLGEQSWLNQRVCKFFSRKDSVSELFIYYSVKPLLERSQYGKVGTTVIHLGKTDIDRYEIFIPSEDVLQKFKTQSQEIHKKIIANQHQIRTLAHLRDTLLPKLMSGSVAV